MNQFTIFTTLVKTLLFKVQISALGLRGGQLGDICSYMLLCIKYVAHDKVLLKQKSKQHVSNCPNWCPKADSTLMQCTDSSNNHRMRQIGRDHSGSFVPSTLLKLGHTKHMAYDYIQMVLENVPWGRLHNLSGQCIAVQDHPHSKEVLPRVPR